MRLFKLCANQWRPRLLLAVTVLVAFAPTSVWAGVVYSSGFESPTFGSGDHLLGKDGWSTAIPPFLNPDVALITNGNAASGQQSVIIRAADLASSNGITDPYDAVGSYRHPLNYDATGQIVRVEVDLFLSGPITTDRSFGASLAVRAGGATVSEFEVFSNGTAGTFGNVPPGSDPTEESTLSLNQWNHLTIDVDFTGRKSIFYLNGNPFSTAIDFSGGSVGNQLDRVAFVVYALPDDNGFQRGAYEVYYDNLSVQTIPEPASLTMLAAGMGLAMFGRRCLRQKGIGRWSGERMETSNGQE
jgi:hypothetical protein